MNQDFAKIFRHPEVGQILVERCCADEFKQPVINIKFRHTKSGKLIFTQMGYENSDDGILHRDTAFERFNEDWASYMVEFSEYRDGRALTLKLKESKHDH